MGTKDWIILLVPIIFGTLFTIVVTNVNNKMLSKKNKKKQIIKDILTYILKIRNIIHQIRYQQVESFKKGMENYFNLSGDLQVFIHDNREVIKKMNKLSRKKFVELESINKLSDLIRETGELLLNKDKSKEFGVKFNESEMLCDKLIKDLNNNLLKFD